MYEKTSKVWGVGLVVVLLVSWLSLAAPASADMFAWSAESTPGTTGEVILPDSDVVDVAVGSNGTTIYAAVGTTSLYKSTNAGTSWTSFTVAAEVDLVAVAPDDDNIVACAKSEATVAVYFSTNGGSSWTSLGTPKQSGGTEAAAIYDIAISKVNEGVRYIAVAGKETSGADDVANMWYFNSGATVPVWKEGNTLSGFSDANVIKALAFSPNFPSDETLVAVS